jgi:hypothetical protein
MGSLYLYTIRQIPFDNVLDAPRQTVQSISQSIKIYKHDPKLSTVILASAQAYILEKDKSLELHQEFDETCLHFKAKPAINSAQIILRKLGQ